MSTAALVARFANTPSWMSAFIAAGITAVTYNLASFCSTDPPAVPTFVAQDFVDLLQFANWGARVTAQLKLQDWISANIWRDVCMCVSGAQPAYPTPPTPPANLPSLNPPGILPPTGVVPTCFDQVFLTGPMSSGTFEYAAWLWHTLNPPPQWVRFRGGRSVTGAGPHTNSVVTMLMTGNGATPIISSVTYNSPPLLDVIVPVPLGATEFRVDASASASTSDLFSAEISGYCTSQYPSGLGGSPCCPPDDVLRAEIDQILGLVTLIQRQSVPFAYVPGTVHTGLSGAGTLSVQGLIGAKVAFTTLPSELGRVGTSPVELFDAGFITWGTADGYPQSEHLEHSPQLSLPARCSAFTSLAYDLHPGVVVTITELVREP
jgi:hypothetical protein